MTVYVLSPDNNKPSGGVKILYRHVDVLNRNGIEAAVLHQARGFRCDWFRNETRIEYLENVRLGAEDFLVIPEIYGPNIAAMGSMPAIGRQARKVIFNQNCRYTFLGQTLESVLAPHFELPYQSRPEFAGAIVVSEDSRDYLEFAFPGLDVWRIHNAIDAALFSFQGSKKRQICFMPRKHSEDAIQVLGMLSLRGSLRGFEVVAIDGMTEVQVAEVMKSSMFFLSFGYPEGCPLPPAEAMACGCVVVGYDGFGGREYFDPAFSRPVEVGDICAYVQEVENLVEMALKTPSAIQDLGEQASRFVTRTYSAEREEEDILSIWRALL